MSRIPSYSKIFAVGSDRIPDLFTGEVEITEKVDGSQFAFGLDSKGDLVMRSKGAELFAENYAKMFDKAVNWCLDNQETIYRILEPDTYVYSEFLGSPKHNVLHYERVPKNHIAIFGIRNGNNWVKKYGDLQIAANALGLDVVPLLYQGVVSGMEKLNHILEKESYLGGQIVEGVVVKNYDAPCFIGNMVLPSLGKYVREEFKEKHAKDWKPKFGFTDNVDAFVQGFRTEARWDKAIQHLREKGELENEPKDIGKLLKEVKDDLFVEETEYIMGKLFSMFAERIGRESVRGFPEYYKAKLAERAFKNEA